MNSNFLFLSNEFSILANRGTQAEKYIHDDPTAALFKMRLFGEKMVEKIFEIHQLEFPFENTAFRRLQKLEEEGLLEARIVSLFHTIRKSGNQAAHAGRIDEQSLMGLLFSVFKLSKWFYESYSEVGNDISDLHFHKPEKAAFNKDYQALGQEYVQLEQRFTELLKEREIGTLSPVRSATIKQRATKAALKIEMSEAETRHLIDDQLRSAGWEVDTATINNKLHGTLPQKGKNKAIAEWRCGNKWADYALFIGTELYGLVEAKKYAQDISTDLTQSKRYAELGEKHGDVQILGQWGNYRVPFLFSTNGRAYLKQLDTKSGIWFLNGRSPVNHSRSLKGWFSPEGIKRLWEQAEDCRKSNSKMPYIRFYYNEIT